MLPIAMTLSTTATAASGARLVSASRFSKTSPEIGIAVSIYRSGNQPVVWNPIYTGKMLGLSRN